MNEVEKLMGTKPFTSSEFNKRLNSVIEHGLNGKVTLNFLFVARELGMVRCVDYMGNQYRWEVIVDECVW